jgi:diacylglycerol O-acyltransferase / wax synthase
MRDGVEQAPAAIDRLSDADLAFLSMDSGAVPEQFAAVLVLGGPVDVAVAERVLAERIARVPRLRQRLEQTPPGGGRRVWVDDSAFDLRRHLRQVHCGPPGDDAALLATVVPLVVERLPRDRPMWRAALVDGVAGGDTALLLVAHHVLADGLGGLAVLEQPIDGPPQPAAAGFPRRPPTATALVTDALRARLRAARQIPRSWRRLRRAMAAGGGLTPAPATPCSLNHRTGPRRRAVVADAELSGIRRTAHRYGGTVNAALLIAVSAALNEVLRQRGEALDRIVVAVPVAGRAAADGTHLGNQVAPLLVSVPTTGCVADRIGLVADAVSRRRGLATGPPPIAVLGPAFRLAAALGGYRWYMNHQHRLHTLVSFVRGPQQRARFAGAVVRRMIPVVVGTAGNITVAFQALSYGDTLTVTAVADPDRCPDLAALGRALQDQLTNLASDTAAHGTGGAAGYRPASARIDTAM